MGQDVAEEGVMSESIWVVYQKSPVKGWQRLRSFGLREWAEGYARTMRNDSQFTADKGFSYMIKEESGVENCLCETQRRV